VPVKLGLATMMVFSIVVILVLITDGSGGIMRRIMMLDRVVGVGYV